LDKMGIAGKQASPYWFHSVQENVMRFFVPTRIADWVLFNVMSGTRRFYKKKKAKEAADASTTVKKGLSKQQTKALSWAEGDEDVADVGGLRIVILKHMFDPAEADGASFYEELKVDIGSEVERRAGAIEKITIFEGNPEGAVAVKFKSGAAAEKCIDLMNGRFFGGQAIECAYFDGVTNYKVQKPDDSEQRMKEFGDWLEQGGEPPAAVPAAAAAATGKK